jgi:hypothetical protein
MSDLIAGLNKIGADLLFCVVAFGIVAGLGLILRLIFDALFGRLS